MEQLPDGLLFIFEDGAYCQEVLPGVCTCNSDAGLLAIFLAAHHHHCSTDGILPCEDWDCDVARPRRG